MAKKEINVMKDYIHIGSDVTGEDLEKFYANNNVKKIREKKFGNKKLNEDTNLNKEEDAK